MKDYLIDEIGWCFTRDVTRVISQYKRGVLQNEDLNKIKGFRNNLFFEIFQLIDIKKDDKKLSPKLKNILYPRLIFDTVNCQIILRFPNEGIREQRYKIDGELLSNPDIILNELNQFKAKYYGQLKLANGAWINWAIYGWDLKSRKSAFFHEIKGFIDNNSKIVPDIYYVLFPIEFKNDIPEEIIIQDYGYVDLPLDYYALKIKVNQNTDLSLFEANLYTGAIVDLKWNNYENEFLDARDISKVFINELPNFIIERTNVNIEDIALFYDIGTGIKQMIGEKNNIHIYTFHSLCKEWAKKANIVLSEPDPLTPQEDYFKYDLPNSLIEAMEVVTEKFDAIIVDEGQDFNASWWLPLELLLNDDKNGIFYIFYDDNQILYDRRISFPINEKPFLLKHNCRNTQKIHDIINNYYKGDYKPDCLGPLGRDIEIINVNNEKEELKALRSQVHKLVVDNNINLSDIIVLTPSNQKRSIWQENNFIGNFQVSWQENNQSNKLFFSTIHSFKGLEKAVVILTETHLINKKNKNNLMYIALSRATNHIILINRGNGII